MKFHDQESRKPHDPHLQRLSREAFINTELICHRLGASSDVSVRSIRLDWSSLERECVIQLIFLDGMVNSQVLQESIIPAIQSAPPVPEGYSLPRYFSDQILTAGQVRITGDMTGAVKDILSGCLLMLIDGYDEALALAIQGYEKRSIGETKTETVIRGPQEAFTDDLRTNITMIRRKMKDERLRIVTRSVGQVTQTDVSILYIEGLADEPVLDRIAEMFDEIGLKMVLEGEYIEEYLQGNKYTVFPTILNTERPDSITAGLAEGRVAIIVDGTPFAMIVPSLFIDFIQSAEDSYQPYLFSSLVRVLRLAAVIISVFAPGLYIAITTFHQDLLPTRLLLSIMFQREGVPFPAFVEAPQHRPGCIHCGDADRRTGCGGCRHCLGRDGYCSCDYRDIKLCHSRLQYVYFHPDDPFPVYGCGCFLRHLRDNRRIPHSCRAFMQPAVCGNPLYAPLCPLSQKRTGRWRLSQPLLVKPAE
jgi:spore germination protein KA